MKIKFFIFCLFFYLNSNCQTAKINVETNSSKVGLTKEEFNYACNEFKKMMLTDAYIQNEKKSRDFADKMGNILDYKNLPIDSLNDKSLFLKLIEKHIKKTKFKSIKEVKIELEDQVASTEKLEKENHKLYELMKKANFEQFKKINQPFFDKSRKELLGN